MSHFRIHNYLSRVCNVSLLANKSRQWKSMLTHQGWFNLLYMQPLLVSHTTEFVICISIYIRLHAVTFSPTRRVMLLCKWRQNIAMTFLFCISKQLLSVVSNRTSSLAYWKMLGIQICIPSLRGSWPIGKC